MDPAQIRAIRGRKETTFRWRQVLWVSELTSSLAVAVYGLEKANRL